MTIFHIAMPMIADVLPDLHIIVADFIQGAYLFIGGIG